ncbi:MAG: peptidylprolyl isomerase [Clostridia bacterium]|nr:peptidylprolyl isomerase [Clostridia bacterium]
MKKIISAILVCVLAMGMLTGCGKVTMDDILKDTNMVIGSVDGQDIHAYEMIFYLKQGMGAQEVQDAIVQNKVLLNLAAENGVEFNDDMQAQIDSFIESQTTQMGSKEALEQAVMEAGVTLDQYTSLYKEALITQSAVDKIIELGVVKDATDEEAREFFDKYCLKAQHILFSTVSEDGQTPVDDETAKAKLAKAEETAKLIKDGADFDSFANLNEDPGAESMPGGYVFANTSLITDEIVVATVQQAGLAMVEPFEAGAAALKPGEVSGVITSNFGHHIIKRLELTDDDFEQYKATIKGVVSNMKFTQFMTDAESKAKVEWNKSAVEALSTGVTPIQAAQQ